MDGQATVQRRILSRTITSRPQHETDRSRALNITMHQHHARKRDHTSPAYMRNNEREWVTAMPQPSQTPFDHRGPRSACGRLGDKASAQVVCIPRPVHEALGHLAPCASSFSRTSWTSRRGSRPRLKLGVSLSSSASTVDDLYRAKGHIAQRHAGCG